MVRREQRLPAPLLRPLRRPGAVHRVPDHFRGPKGTTKEEYGEPCVAKFARPFETEYNGVWDPKTYQCGSTAQFCS